MTLSLIHPALCIRDSLEATHHRPRRNDRTGRQPQPAAQLVTEGVGVDIRPVSYTHLDVYKRQIPAMLLRHIEVFSDRAVNHLAEVGRFDETPGSLIADD